MQIILFFLKSKNKNRKYLFQPLKLGHVGQRLRIPMLIRRRKRRVCRLTTATQRIRSSSSSRGSSIGGGGLARTQRWRCCRTRTAARRQLRGATFSRWLLLLLLLLLKRRHFHQIDLRLRRRNPTARRTRGVGRVKRLASAGCRGNARRRTRAAARAVGWRRSFAAQILVCTAIASVS